MLAIPVAQMLIWWFAGTDPLGLGPKIGSFAPFVVPVEFRQEAENEFDKIFDEDVTSDNGKIELLVSEENSETRIDSAVSDRPDDLTFFDFENPSSLQPAKKARVTHSLAPSSDFDRHSEKILAPMP